MVLPVRLQGDKEDEQTTALIDIHIYIPQMSTLADNSTKSREKFKIEQVLFMHRDTEDRYFIFITI